MNLKKKIILSGVIVMIISISLNILMWKRNGILKEDYQRQLKNVTVLTTPSKTDTIRDSIPVTVQGVISENTNELQRQNILDKRLIKDLKLKIKDLSTVSTISISNSDTVPLTKTDSIFKYKDAWTNINVNIPAAICSYNTRDSLQTYLYAIYRHRFLWWRWGKAGYNIKIVNFNPHSHITYSRIINIEK